MQNKRTIKHPRVLVAVLNWNSYTTTLECLESLRNLEYFNYGILVIDNDSTDDSVRRLREAMPDLRIIHAQSNLGYAAGNRLALDVARQQGADLLWILNNDATVKPNTLGALIHAYRHFGEGVYGSVPIEVAEGSGKWHIAFVPRSIATLEHKLRYLFSLKIAYDDMFPARKTQAVSMLSGSSLLVPLSVVDKYGFMDPSYFMYAEELDYCYRLQANDVPVIIVPRSVIFHERQGASQERPELRAMLNYYQVRNRLVFCWRHERLTFFLTIIKEIVRIVVWLLLFFRHPLTALRTVYYSLVGLRDGLLIRSGKVFAPNDYVG